MITDKRTKKKHRDSKQRDGAVRVGRKRSSMCGVTLCLLVFSLLYTRVCTRAQEVVVPSSTSPLDSVCIDTAYYDTSSPAPYYMHGTMFHLPRLSEIRTIHRDSSLNKKEKLREYGNFFVRIIDAFDAIDPTYVERIGYNFTAMLQATNTFEFYNIGTRDYAETVSFAQHPDLRIGPYFGWRWLFLGYTFDVTNLGNKAVKTGQKFEFSIYTSMIGLDLIYRKTGSDFYLRKINGLGEQARIYESEDCHFIDANVMGASIYYNINHRKFSSPAVFSQSTIQRRSAGSGQVGISITHHDIHYHYDALPNELFAETSSQNQYRSLERLKYIDYSLTGGYAYNWVLGRGWCLGLAVTPAIGYKRTSAKTVVFKEEDDDADPYDSPFRNKLDEIFRRKGNVNFDITGRLGLIYNSGRWFIGAFGVIHNYNYHRAGLRFSNTFGNANLCVGFYFQKKKKKNGQLKVEDSTLKH